MKKNIACLLSTGLIFYTLPSAAYIGTASAADTDYKYTFDNGEVTLTGSSLKVSPLEIPDKIEGLPVTAIGDNFFKNNTDITSVSLPDSIVTIGEKAFSNCTGLTSISIGSDTAYIDEQAFSACPKLKEISVSTDNKVYRSENGSLYKNDHLITYAGEKDAVIAPDTSVIEKYAFFGKTDLLSVTIPNSVTTIGDYAFSGCLSLKNADIPASVTDIGVYCFLSCTALGSAKISPSLQKIPDSCFYGCSGLKTINIPDSVTAIDNYAFFGCDSLTDIYIPGSVTSIGKHAIGIKFNIRSNTYEPVQTLTIHGTENSEAQNYADDSAIKFQPDGGTVYGDVNSDSIIDAKDASLTLSQYALLSSGHEGILTEKQMLSADFNKDGTVDAKDASAILTHYAVSSVSKDN